MNREHRLSKDKPYPSVGDVNFPKVVRKAADTVEPTSEVTTTPAERAPTTNPKPWSLKENFLSKSEADLLYERMLKQPWIATGNDCSAIIYGLSYQHRGGARPNGISR
jgi:hypothetical protein